MISKVSSRSNSRNKLNGNSESWEFNQMQSAKVNYFTTARGLLGLFAIILLSGCAKPIADFSYEGKNRTAPAKIDFKNSSENAETYQWDFGDGNTSDEAEPDHKYMASGNYTVILKATKGKKTNTMEKRVVIDAPKECLVIIETPYGEMTAKLYNETPQHRDNFIKLAEEGYFNDLLFHRVIDGFMIQGGDPKSRDARPDQPLGSGGPGYTVPAEFVDSLVHVKGALAAARTGDQVNPKRNSSGSQFYIVHGQKVTADQIKMMEARKGITYSEEAKEIYMEEGGTPFLDKDYTVFGRVIKGLDVIDKIAAVQTGRSDRPMEDVKMKVTVIK